MASSSKRQTTMAKLAREQSVREKRVKKAERREARIVAAATARDMPPEVEGEIDVEAVGSDDAAEASGAVVD
jgi:hypothetical protein